jgi:hypothetical protein
LLLISSKNYGVYRPAEGYGVWGPKKNQYFHLGSLTTWLLSDTCRYRNEEVMLGLKSPGVWLALLILIEAGSVWAAEDRKTLQITAHIRPQASLTLSRSLITFAGEENQPAIQALEGPVQVKARGRASESQPLTLTARADSDLQGGAASIPISLVQWTAQGEGLRNGALNRFSDQLVGRWTKSGVNQGQLEFALKNNGNLVPGDYATSVTLTLSSP